MLNSEDDPVFIDDYYKESIANCDYSEAEDTSIGENETIIEDFQNDTNIADSGNESTVTEPYANDIGAIEWQEVNNTESFVRVFSTEASNVYIRITQHIILSESPIYLGSLSKRNIYIDYNGYNVYYEKPLILLDGERLYTNYDNSTYDIKTNIGDAREYMCIYYNELDPPLNIDGIEMNYMYESDLCYVSHTTDISGTVAGTTLMGEISEAIADNCDSIVILHRDITDYEHFFYKNHVFELDKDRFGIGLVRSDYMNDDKIISLYLDHNGHTIDPGFNWGFLLGKNVRLVSDKELPSVTGTNSSCTEFYNIYPDIESGKYIYFNDGIAHKYVAGFTKSN